MLKSLLSVNDVAVPAVPSNVVAVITPLEAVIPVPTLSVPTVHIPVVLITPTTLPVTSPD